MDQSGNNNHLLLRASQPGLPGLPGFNGQHSAADRMRELLARTVQDHLVDGHATASALDEIRRRLDALERALDHVRDAVSYTHLRAHETRHDLVCRLLLE